MYDQYQGYYSFVTSMIYTPNGKIQTTVIDCQVTEFKIRKRQILVLDKCPKLAQGDPLNWFTVPPPLGDDIIYG